MNTIQALAIIPARGGSKRLPQKNLRFLGGIPLVEHTLKAASESRCFTKIILSSDDLDILALASRFPGIEPAMRSPELSGDHVTVLTLVNAILEQPGIATLYNAVAVMLPTAPFRNAHHVKEAFRHLTPSVDGVVSLAPLSYPPQISVRMEGNSIRPLFVPSPLYTGNTRSQDQEPTYRPNGGIYIQWLEKFRINKNFWKGNISGFIMSEDESIDIDTQRDLDYANFLMARL